MRHIALITLFFAVAFGIVQAQNPEPAGWYAGDMHVHRSCGGSPVSESSVIQKMSTNNIAAVSLLADMGNGEVQNPTADLPLVNGKDDPLSTSGRILHWDAEWHWDATYSQYAHQALGGHLVALGLNQAHQIWDESTDTILQWAHAQNAVTGFAHLQYLDAGIPTTLTCCTPFEYPVEVALGAADFISEDVTGSDTAIQNYYRMLNSGFRPGFAAGTDYPCNDGTTIGSPLTYVLVPNGQMTYRNWIDGIAAGRTVVSRNGHNEFLDLKVNGTAMPGDEIDLSSGGTVQVSVQWSAAKALSGTIELVSNGMVVASKQASLASGSSTTLTTTVNFAKSGWLAARRMDSTSGHMVQTGAVFVIVNNAPIRANATDPQFYVQWIGNLLTQTSPSGGWNYFFPTELAATQQRYQDASALYQQIAKEAQGTGAALSSIAVSPANVSAAIGTTQQYIATGRYADGSTVNITSQVVWSSSNTNAATISTRGLAVAQNSGSATITATQGTVMGSAFLTVQANPLTITTQSLPAGTIGVSYSSTLTANGGTLPYTWSIASGSLPTGLTLNSGTGVISGTPSAVGTFNMTDKVTDASSPAQVVTKALTITVTAPGAGPYSIWPSTAVPGLADAGADSAVEIGVEFRSDLDGYITGIRFYKSAANTGTHVGHLWSSAGTQLASATFSGETTSGWQQVSFSNPVPITAGNVYVASYHATGGHYAQDEDYFVSRGTDSIPLHALQDTASTPNGVYAYGSGTFPSDTWNSTNYWVDVVFMPSGPDTTPPTVKSVSPSAGASGVDPLSSMTATFSETLDASTVNGNSVQLLDASALPVQATVSYNAGSSIVTLTSTSALLNSSTYTMRIKGGIIKDTAGNALAADYSWPFSTAAVPPPPPTEGPGGPILVVSSSTNPFSRYYTEILRNEGLNEFTAMDISLVSASTLNSYDVVILGNFALTSTQAGMFTSWVNNGGNLIAMRPDKQLVPLLGLSDTGTVLADAYLLMNTASAPGKGLVNQTIQFHGNADRYVANGASILATLYSSATASTPNPAVTLYRVGLGSAAAFTFDLARSVIYTRQGNPAWSGQSRDGQSGPIRSDNLFYGAAPSDSQPDYVDRSRITIPQADEQQRLLANLIIQMNLNKRLLPRFWYFPRDVKAAVVMTGDDHGSMYGGGTTASRFAHYSSFSPANCSVADWQCVRSTAYLLAPSIASNPLTNAQAASYIAQGFEVGAHVDSVPDCTNWTTTQLATFYTTQISSFKSKYTSAPQQKTHRMHCVGWSDYDSQPQVELQNNIRLDTNYYYWPPEWVNDDPGMFTGSGMPMRFTKRDGTMLDIYQATTQMTDESGQSYPLHINTLLDNAVGATGYYGFFTANMHNDDTTYDEADAIIGSAQSRGVPIISAAQLLTWLDGRNGSSFTSLSWDGMNLGFGIAVGSGANGLRAMLPASSGTGTLSSVRLNGSQVAFTLTTIKGISYAAFPASPGTYQASYTATSGITISSVTMNPSTVVGGTTSTGTVNLNGPAPSGGAQVSLTTSDTSTTTLSSPSVTVLQGATSAVFTVNTNGVTATKNVVISGTYAGDTASANLTVTPAPTLTALAVNPNTVVGGTSSTGTATLSGPAPAGGVTITLSSSNTGAATVPASIVVSAGASTATFTINTTAVTNTTSVSITASYGGSGASASLTVNPAPSLSSIAFNPANVVGTKPSTGTVTLTQTAPSGGVVVSLTSTNPAVASVPASVTVAAGNTTATFTVTTYAVNSLTEVTITGTYGISRSATLTVNPPAPSSLALNPTSVVGGNTSTATVTLSGPAPSSGDTVSLSSSNTSVATLPASVVISAGATTATYTVSTTAVATSTSVTLSASYGGGTATALLTVTPTVALSTLALSPANLVGGTSSTGKVTLTRAAGSGGFLVNLMSSNPATASVPASVTVAAGSTTRTFTVTTSPVATQAAVVITASAGSVNKTAALTVNPPALSSLSLSSTSVVGGTNSRGTVRLSGRAPASGIVLALTSSNTTAASVPSSVTVLSGANSATFTITTHAMGTSTTSTISATYGTVTRTATLTVRAPSLSSLTISPSTVKGGSSTIGTATLNGPAPTAGAVVGLSSNSAYATVPASVTVAAGGRTATFTITTGILSANGTATITGSYNGTRSATFTITP